MNQPLDMSRSRLLRGALSLLLALPLVAAAKDWPTRPIRLVVPYPAGGLTDAITRVIGAELGHALGTTVVVDNKAGAGGQIGLQDVLSAPRDGHTVALVVPATMNTLPLSNPNYRIKPLQDFVPVTAAVQTAAVLVARKDLGLRNLEDFVAYVRQQGERLTTGVPGLGTSYHFHTARLAKLWGVRPTIVAYPGEVQVYNDLARGQLDFALLSTTMGAQIRSGGKVVPIAVTGQARNVNVPDVPTFKEQGVDFDTDGWVGYAVAAGTPPEIVERLYQAFDQALRAPAVRTKLMQLGLEVLGSRPEVFRTEIEANTACYTELVRTGVVTLK